MKHDLSEVDEEIGHLIDELQRLNEEILIETFPVYRYCFAFGARS